MGQQVQLAEQGLALTMASMQPAPKKEKLTPAAKAKAKGKNGYYMDLIWTPAIQAQKDKEKEKEDEFAQALYTAFEMQGSASVALSQLGADYKVAQLKKDIHFKNTRLLDILKQYDEIFELFPDGAGGWTVRLQPGAEAALPGGVGATSFAEECQAMSAMLPERLDDPRNVKEKMQALRIELLHALHRRGGKVPLQELGQEPRVQQRKTGLHQAKKLIDFLRVFPLNFVIQADATQMIVEIGSLDVSDQNMIERSILTNQQTMNPYVIKGKGKGGFYSGYGSRDSNFGTSRPIESIKTYDNSRGFDSRSFGAGARDVTSSVRDRDRSRDRSFRGRDSSRYDSRRDSRR